MIRIKQELKAHIDEWVRMKNQLEIKKREYEELNTVVKDKHNIVKQYMTILEGDKKTINCNLNENGKWLLKLRTSADYKQLSKKALIKIVGEEEATAIWNERERKPEKTEVVLKQDKAAVAVPPHAA